MIKRMSFDLSSSTLRILAMALMVCDHLWGTIVSGNDWLTCLGRLSFPIFAFLLVEGYFHTNNFKKYWLRLLIFALLSEIPFNLVMSGRVFYPVHQNVLWSFLISLLLIYWNEHIRQKGKRWLTILVSVASILIGYLAGLLTMVDFYHAGILTVLAFYFFHGRRWWCYVGQFCALYYINIELLGGFFYELNLWGHTLMLSRQGLALLALIPIWLYRGRQGLKSKPFRLISYLFYPAHLLILGLLGLFIV